MRGLTIMVADASPERFRAALTMAAAQAALDGAARLFLSGAAVSLARPPIAHAADTACAYAGQPTLAELFDEALGQGVRIILCQSGLQLAGMRAEELDGRLEYGGMVSLLQTLGDDRLVTL